MEINKNNLALSFIVVIITLALQLCFGENKVSAMGMTVNNYSPAHNSSGVGVSDNLVLTFSRNWTITGTIGTIEIHEANGTLFESYSFPAYPANITGEHTNTMTINPTGTLTGSMSYYVLFTSSMILSDDSDDYHYAGLINNTQWNFATEAACYNPPSCFGPCFGTDDVDHLSPPDNAHFMQSSEGLAIVFGTTVTMGSGNIYIRLYSNDSTVETIDVTGNKVTGWGTNTLTINPSTNLANNTHYYVNFDIVGWSLPADKDKWDFWTKATPNTFSGTGL